MVTDMVKFRKLTSELIDFFPDPSAKLAVQTNGLFENEPVSRPFFGGKSWRTSAILCQNVAEYGRKSPFVATAFIKKCQVARTVSSFERRPVPPFTH